jgi:hypothetical protein
MCSFHCYEDLPTCGEGGIRTHGENLRIGPPFDDLSPDPTQGISGCPDIQAGFSNHLR